jgi:hypothetical protein
MNNDFQIREIGQMPVRPINPHKSGLASLFSKKNLPKFLIVVFVLLFIFVIGTIFWGRGSFSKTKIDLKINLPDDIASGKEITIIVDYKNNNRVSLNSPVLTINYPSGAFTSDGKEIFHDEKKLGAISKKSGGSEQFKVRLVGNKGDIKNLTARLDYQPQNINSRFENSATVRAEINFVLIGIKIEGPDKVIGSQDMSYIIEYDNKTDSDITNLKIEIEYPEDFKLQDSEPEPSQDKNNIWQIDRLKAGEKKIISLEGVLSGEEGQSKNLKIAIGKMEDDIFMQYSQAEFLTQIAPSPILILIKPVNHEDECNLNAGEEVNYKIEFKNNTDVALQQFVLNVYLNDRVFDLKSVRSEKGFLDSRENAIVWSGSEIPKLKILEPNSTGEVSFFVEIKEEMPISGYNDKNFEAVIVANIATLTVPDKFALDELVIEKELNCKINTKLDLASKVYYYEPRQGIYNTGLIPPKVNQLTTYTVHWQIINTSNDAENVKVRTALPQGISWMNYYIKDIASSQVSYNERTKEVLWEISKVSSGTGVIGSPYELVFQIGLTPSVNQVGQTPIILNESTIEAKDSFTKIILNDSTSFIDTSLPDDSRIGYSEGRVRE